MSFIVWLFKGLINLLEDIKKSYFIYLVIPFIIYIIFFAIYVFVFNYSIDGLIILVSLLIFAFADLLILFYLIYLDDIGVIKL